MASDYSPGYLIEETFALIVEQKEFLSKNTRRTSIHKVEIDGQVVYRAHLHSLFPSYVLELPSFKDSLADVVSDWPSVSYDTYSLWFQFQ